MPNRISSILGVDSKLLLKKGVFDGFTDIDSRLHIDPGMLAVSTIPEFVDAKKVFDGHFKDTLLIISKIQRSRDIFWRKAHGMLQFKEVANTALGYSKGGTGGNAIGPILAEKILDTAYQIIKAGIDDPAIFEIVGVIEEGIGADRLSDLTVSILLKNFAAYTERIARELKVAVFPVKIRGQQYYLPINKENRKRIFFVPKSLLNSLPIAYEWTDIDIVCRYNEELRAKFNKMLGETWKAAVKLPKQQLRRILLDNPDLIRDIIEQYKTKPRGHYDFQNDPLGELIWADLSESIADVQLLDFGQFLPLRVETILSVVRMICLQYKSLIENNGWFEYLYDQTGKLKPERASQLLFYGVAEAYCSANDLDLSRETNGGIGSLDFKLSRGFKSKVNVEIKYSTNTNLMKGFKNQLPAYNRAEKTNHSIFLVIQTKAGDANIRALLTESDEMIKAGRRVPEIIVIDGQKQVSASKR